MKTYKLGDKLPVHDHGYVILHETMGSDEVIAQSARVSYDYKGTSQDRGLIRYLMRHRHTSPFEMAEMRFELKMPIFVARQWVRHRTANMNEVSARYTQLPQEMFVPETWACQSKDNKQGRDDFGASIEDEYDALSLIEFSNKAAYADYEKLLEKDTARELARGVLPLNTYTKFIWKIDLHNLMHFLSLRLHPHAQKEIRDYAEAIYQLVKIYYPITAEAFRDYVLESYTLSRMERDLLRELLAIYMKQHQYPTLDIANSALNNADKRFKNQVSGRELKEFKETFLRGLTEDG